MFIMRPKSRWRNCSPIPLWKFWGEIIWFIRWNWARWDNINHTLRRKTRCFFTSHSGIKCYEIIALWYLTFIINKSYLWTFSIAWPGIFIVFSNSCIWNKTCEAVQQCFSLNVRMNPFVAQEKVAFRTCYWPDGIFNWGLYFAIGEFEQINQKLTSMFLHIASFSLGTPWQRTHSINAWYLHNFWYYIRVILWLDSHGRKSKVVIVEFQEKTFFLLSFSPESTKSEWVRFIDVDKFDHIVKRWLDDAISTFEWGIIFRNRIEK